jgi:hypothetical protein
MLWDGMRTLLSSLSHNIRILLQFIPIDIAPLVAVPLIIAIDLPLLLHRPRGLLSFQLVEILGFGFGHILQVALIFHQL